MDYDLVYNSYGNRLYSKYENNKGVIVKNPEPWVNNKNYNRILLYLNDNKSI